MTSELESRILSELESNNGVLLKSDIALLAMDSNGKIDSDFVERAIERLVSDKIIEEREFDILLIRH